MDRIKQLKKNYSRIFWLEALFYLNLVNMIAVLFYIQRGLSIKQVILLSVVYSVINLIFEIPSSYLADTWGRKKTIILATVILTSNYVLAIFSYGFIMFAIVMALYSLALSLLSGTSEALVYDTNVELKEDEHNLKRLATLHSAKHIFKIIIPFIATFVARDLTETQFISLYIANATIGLITLSIALSLTEADNQHDAKKKQFGVLKDAVNLIKNNSKIRTAILNRLLIFISSVLIFLIFQKLFVDLGISIVTIGIIWSSVHAIKFFIMKNYTKIFHDIKFNKLINSLNLITTILMFICFILLEYYPLPLIALILFAISTITVMIRNPLFSQYFNHNSNSFNRATTLSLINLSKAILDIPLIFISAYVVSININYIFVLAFVICLTTILFFRIKNNTKLKVV